MKKRLTKKTKILYPVILVFVVLLATQHVLAYDAVAPIPGVKYSTSDPSQLIGSLYDWGIGIVGILAFIQLVRGGVTYMVSGAVSTKDEAKSIITDALVGLLLALTSALIINIINPQLIQLESTSLDTHRCMTGDRVTYYLNAGFYCEADATMDCSDKPGTGGFLCKK